MKTIKTGSGYPYGINLDDDQIHEHWTPELADVSDESYPKIGILLEVSQFERNAGGTRIDTYHFSLVLLVKKIGDRDRKAPDKLDRLLEDVKAAFHANDSLGGNVQDAFLNEAIIDNGQAAPVGMAVAGLLVTVMNH